MSFFKRLRLWFNTIILILFVAGCEVENNQPMEDGPDPVFDDFERVTLGNNWTVYSGDVGIINNSDIGINSKTKRLGIVAWNTTLFSVDQFSQAVISLDKEPGILQQVFVRRRISDGQRYGFHWNSAHGGRWGRSFD